MYIYHRLCHDLQYILSEPGMCLKGSIIHKPIKENFAVFSNKEADFKPISTTKSSSVNDSKCESSNIYAHDTKDESSSCNSEVKGSKPKTGHIKVYGTEKNGHQYTYNLEVPCNKKMENVIMNNEAENVVESIARFKQEYSSADSTKSDDMIFVHMFPIVLNISGGQIAPKSFPGGPGQNLLTQEHFLYILMYKSCVNKPSVFFMVFCFSMVFELRIQYYNVIQFHNMLKQSFKNKSLSETEYTSNCQFLKKVIANEPFVMTILLCCAKFSSKFESISSDSNSSKSKYPLCWLFKTVGKLQKDTNSKKIERILTEFFETAASFFPIVYYQINESPFDGFLDVNDQYSIVLPKSASFFEQFDEDLIYQHSVEQFLNSPSEERTRETLTMVKLLNISSYPMYSCTKTLWRG
ncbi:hypothetical protein P9112_014401 [Eukaryota sp. TZLM1-RC]